jgi:hypothetical protein
MKTDLRRCFVLLVCLLTLGLVAPADTGVMANRTHVAAAGDSCVQTSCSVYLPLIQPLSPGVEALALQDTTLVVANTHALVLYTLHLNDQYTARQALYVGEQAIDLAVDADIVYWLTRGETAGSGQLTIIDGLRTGQLRLRSRLLSLNYPSRILVENGFAYVVEGAHISVIDVQDPERPVRRSTYTPTTGDVLSDLAVHNGIGYVANGDVLTIDFRNPDQPVLLAAFVVPGLARAITVSGDLAYVDTYFEASSVLNISDPSNPVSVGRYTGSLPYPGRSTIAGKLLVVTGVLSRHGGCASILYDVTDRAHPQPVTLPEIDRWSCITDAVAVGQRLYIGDRYRGLQAISLGS